MTSRWTQLGAQRMHARVWASAPDARVRPTIVLVHGLGVSSRYMIPTAEHLAPTHCVYAPDLPGFGLSEAPSRPNSIEENARALDAWMRECDIARPVLVGNSYGCQVIAALVAKRPERAAGLVLSGPTVDRYRRSAATEIARLVRDAPLERMALLPVVVIDYLRAGPRTMLATFRDALADRIEDKLSRIALPTLLVRGGRDPLVSEAWIEYLAGVMAHASTVTLAGAPHAVNFSAPNAFAEAILVFMNELV